MRRGSVASHFAVNLGGAIVPVVVALVTVPLYIRSIGLERYGVLSIVWILLGYFGFLDLGMSRAATNALSRLKRGEPERGEVLATSLAMNVGLGLLGAAFLFLAGDALLTRAVTMSPAVRDEALAAMPAVALLLPLAMANGVLLGALELRERFVLANGAALVQTTLGQMLPVIAALLVAPTLDVVIPTAVAARSLGIMATLVIVLREERPVRLRFSPARLRPLLGYGGWHSISSIVGPLLVSLDQLVIARLLDASAVAHYAVPKTLIVRTQVLAGALSRTLFPRMSRAGATEARDLAERATVTLAFAFGACCAVGIVLMRPFLSLWIDPAFAVATGRAGEILLLGAWINGLAFVPFAMLQGQGRPDVTAKLHLLQLVPFVIILVALTTWLGIEGAAWAWTLRVAADAAILYVAAGFRAQVWRKSVIAGGAVVAAWGLTFLNAPLLAALALAGIIGLLAVVLGLMHDPTGRGLAQSALRRMRS